MDVELRTVVRPKRPVSLELSLAPLRHGRRDPCVRIDGAVVRATRTPDGPATILLRADGCEVQVQAWGPGARWVIEAAPALVGARDDLEGWAPDRHPLVRELDRAFPGLRMVATGAVLEAAVPVVVEQKVTSREAHESWRRMAWGLGDPAPGPWRLRVPPAAERLRTAEYYELHPFGIERRRADVIRRLASRAGRVEEATHLSPADARRRLEAFAGVGVWTSAKVAAVAWGDADAVPVGDYHYAPVIVHALTGRCGGDDDAMLELLEPFRPHRGRAARLVMLSGLGPPRRHPGRPLRDFRRW